MHEHGKERRARTVSFSGIDGAGKSSQIRSLQLRLKESGLGAELVMFWNDVAQLTRFREAAGHTLFRGDRGVGTPAAPINRRDKNVKSWPMTGVRLFLYFVDAISVRISVAKAKRRDVDLAIFDRYIYDELANLTIPNPLIRAYIRLIMKLVPRPDISFLLDADPFQARGRKPEYSLDFLIANRKSYLALSDLIGGFTVIAPMPIPEVEREIFERALKLFPLKKSGRNECGETSSTGENRDPAVMDEPYTRPAAS
jgi:thymidylate kinase